MTMTAIAQPHQDATRTGSLRPALTAITVVWFGAVLLAFFAGGFVNQPGQPPIHFLISVGAPIAAFLAAYAAIPRLRAAVRAADLALLSAVQGWRVAGFVFVAFLAFDKLPGLFAWPAGLGDVAVGLAAPFVALAVLRRPDTATEPRFVLFHWLGILDLAVAVSAGVLSSGLVPGLVGEITTEPLTRMPLVLIPGFLVPMFVILHLTAILKVRQLMREQRVTRG